MDNRTIRLSELERAKIFAEEGYQVDSEIINGLKARIEALEGALRRSNAVAKLLKMGLTPNPTDRDESIEQALAALGGEQHGG